MEGGGGGGGGGGSKDDDAEAEAQKNKNVSIQNSHHFLLLPLVALFFCFSKKKLNADHPCTRRCPDDGSRQLRV